MKKKTSTGKEFERQVARQYRKLSDVEKVEHDKEMAGNQIDVYVEIKTGDGSLHRIAVEAKEYTGQVGVGIVNEFDALKVSFLREAGLIEEGVIVSSHGFTKPARQAADARRIRLLEFADLEMWAEKESKRGFLWKEWRWVLVACILILVVVILVLFFSWGSVTELARNVGASVQGHRERTLWDWMDLLLVPGALALGAWLLNRSAGRREARAQERQAQNRIKIEAQRTESEQKLELARSREHALQAYFDEIGDLMNAWRGDLTPGSSQQTMTRARTLTVLRRLDGERKGVLLRFLYESGLIGRAEATEGQPKEPESAMLRLTAADLSGANLKGANLDGADLAGVDLRLAQLEGASLTQAKLDGARIDGAILRGADLSQAHLALANLVDAYLVGGKLTQANLAGADLTRAILSEAQLEGADLSKANLSEADLKGSDLSKANLEGANLTGADLSRASLKGAELAGCRLEGATVMQEQLDQASSLKGAILPDGTAYTPPKDPGGLNGDEGEPPGPPVSP